MANEVRIEPFIVSIPDEGLPESIREILKELAVQDQKVKQKIMTEEKTGENRVEYSQWLKRGPNTYLPTDNAKTHKSVESGVYSIKYSRDIGFYIFKKDVVLDELIDLPFPETAAVVQGLEKFWSSEEQFKKYKYAYKRGILLYGVPGGGKTSLISLLCKRLVESKDGVIFTLSTPQDLEYYNSFMPEIFRVIEPKRHLITIIEDIDGLCQNKEVETNLINALDGIEQIDRVVYLATTNYTERLSDRIVNRPNRFDIRLEVKSPNAECRRKYFEAKLKKEDLEKVDLEEWIKKTEGMTMAALGEVIKSVVILENDFDETVSRLTGMAKIPLSRNYNKEFGQVIGYSGKS